MPNRVALSVSLTSQLAEFVADKVRSGRYGSASEVVRMSLRLLEKQEPVDAALLTGTPAVKAVRRGR